MENFTSRPRLNPHGANKVSGAPSTASRTSFTIRNAILGAMLTLVSTTPDTHAQEFDMAKAQQTPIAHVGASPQSPKSAIDSSKEPNAGVNLKDSPHSPIETITHHRFGTKQKTDSVLGIHNIDPQADMAGIDQTALQKFLEHKHQPPVAVNVVDPIDKGDKVLAVSPNISVVPDHKTKIPPRTVHHSKADHTSETHPPNEVAAGFTFDTNGRETSGGPAFEMSREVLPIDDTKTLSVIGFGKIIFPFSAEGHGKEKHNNMAGVGEVGANFSWRLLQGQFIGVPLALSAGVTATVGVERATHGGHDSTSGLVGAEGSFKVDFPHHLFVAAGAGIGVPVISTDPKVPGNPVFGATLLAGKGFDF